MAAKKSSYCPSISAFSGDTKSSFTFFQKPDRPDHGILTALFDLLRGTLGYKKNIAIAVL